MKHNRSLRYFYLLLLILGALSAAASACQTGEPTSADPNTLLTPTPLPTPYPARSILPLNPEEGSLQVDEQQRWRFSAPPVFDKLLLTVEARLDWYRTATAAPIMGWLVGDTALAGECLINKSPTYTFMDGRSSSYYHPPDESNPQPAWVLFYSPDFSAHNNANNLSVPSLVSGGNAYLYVFDITELVVPGQENELTLLNLGKSVSQTLNKPVPLAYRRLYLVVDPLE